MVTICLKHYNMATKYTLITGASSGMGALCAKQFSLNQNLILASENLDQLKLVQSECVNPERHILWHCNFASDRNMIADSLCSLLKDNNAEVEKYIHFAGLTKLLPIKNFTIPYVDTIFNVNFFSIIEILRVLLKKVNNGALQNIILISALVSERGNVGNSIYASSKGAINSLVYTLSRELAPIRINALLPGAIETPMTEKLDENYKEEMRRDTPLGFGKPQDVVDYADFLFSDKATWITGQTLFVDGGRNTK